MSLTEQARMVLDQIKDDRSGKSILEIGWLDQVRVIPPKAIVRLCLPSYMQSQRDQLAKEITENLKSLNGIEEVQIEVGNPPEEGGIGHAGHGQTSDQLQPVQGVRHIIAVSSGKGGVGKSTVAVNLACAFAKKNLKVGLLDADIYGPNTPIMLGVADQTPEVIGSGSDQKIVPIESCGIGMVSMGFLIEENQPVIWRGPMLNGIIRQFLYQANWGYRDVLVVDLPPGTGDAQLSLAQAVPMSGVIIVTTPQKVSLQDARRGLAMFQQMKIPVLGVVENMTAFVPPDLPDRSYALFGSGGGQQLAEESGVPLLAKLPMEMPLQEGCNEGIPLVHSSPNSLSSQAFLGLASSIIETINKKI